MKGPKPKNSYKLTALSINMQINNGLGKALSISKGRPGNTNQHFQGLFRGLKKTHVANVV